MKRLICLLVALGIVVSTAGCVNPMVGLIGMMEDTKDGGISILESIEKTIPPPSFLEPYFQSSQAVPLNNIPNADMENWSVAWTKVSEECYPSLTSTYSQNSFGYSGDYFFERGSSLKIYAQSWSVCSYSTPAYNQITVASPSFRLDHDYVTFYMYGILDKDYSTPSQPGYGYGYIFFRLYSDDGTLITEKQLGSISPSSPLKLSIVDTYLTGTFTGEDGKMWNRVTIPMPSSFIGKTVRLSFTGKAVTTACYAYTTPKEGKPSFYIDDFYYSNSDGSEIYALEAPTAQFTYVVDGYDVDVDAGISQTVGTLYTIKWNWGDGTQTTGVTSSHTYSFPGNKQITLTIMSNENLVDTATLTVSVDGASYYAGPQGSNTTNLPPIAGFSYGLTGMTINVDGSYSKDDGTITLYSWDFDGVKKNGITATHTYANSGSKTVTLIVKDNYGLESERKITFDLPIGGVTSDTTVVDNPGTPPTAKFSYTLTAPTVTVDASESSDDVKIEKYEWDWGDGSTSVGKTQSHTYSDMGTTRTITLTVTDDEGFTASSTATVTTISYNEPVDSNTTTYVAPPTTSGTSTPVPSGGNTNTAFPVWGLIVFLTIVGGFVLLILGITGKVKLKGKGKRRKRK